MAECGSAVWPVASAARHCKTFSAAKASLMHASTTRSNTVRKTSVLRTARCVHARTRNGPEPCHRLKGHKTSVGKIDLYVPAECSFRAAACHHRSGLCG